MKKSIYDVDSDNENQSVKKRKNETVFYTRDSNINTPSGSEEEFPQDDVKDTNEKPMPTITRAIFGARFIEPNSSAKIRTSSSTSLAIRNHQIRNNPHKVAESNPYVRISIISKSGLSTEYDESFDEKTKIAISEHNQGISQETIDRINKTINGEFIDKGGCSTEYDESFDRKTKIAVSEHNQGISQKPSDGIGSRIQNRINREATENKIARPQIPDFLPKPYINTSGNNGAYTPGKDIAHKAMRNNASSPRNPEKSLFLARFNKI